MVYARVLERREHLLVKSWILEESYGFPRGRGTLDHLSVLLRTFEEVCKFPTLLHMFRGPYPSRHLCVTITRVVHIAGNKPDWFSANL